MARQRLALAASRPVPPDVLPLAPGASGQVLAGYRAYPGYAGDTSVKFSYANGQKTGESLEFIGGQTYTVGITYDDAGQVNQITYPDSTTVSRTYNARGLLSTISYGGGTIDTRTYDDGGRLTSETLGNGLTVTTTYATNENLIASIANGAVGTYGYSWDANHNKTAETITGAMANYGFTVPGGGYDDEDRLVAWERDDSNLDESWALSDVGDFNSVTTNSTTVNRTHGNAHELTAIGSNSLTYDSKGNLTQDDTGRTYAWNIGNMLTSTTLSGTTVSYAYDALDRRISRAAGGTTTHYFSDGDIVLAEYTAGTAANSPLRKYINASYVDEPVLLIDRTAAGAIGAGSDERLYYHRNQQYSITALMDNSGGVVERYAYTAYGQPTILNAAASSARSASDYGNPYLYTARAFEPDTGLHYFRVRYYQYHLGRFIGRDPFEYKDGPSLVASYFAVAYTDPYGLSTHNDHHWIPQRQYPGQGNLRGKLDFMCSAIFAAMGTNITQFSENLTTRYDPGWGRGTQHTGIHSGRQYHDRVDDILSRNSSCCAALVELASLIAREHAGVTNDFVGPLELPPLDRHGSANRSGASNALLQTAIDTACGGGSCPPAVPVPVSVPCVDPKTVVKGAAGVSAATGLVIIGGQIVGGIFDGIESGLRFITCPTIMLDLDPRDGA